MGGFYLLQLCLRWCFCFRCDFYKSDIVDSKSAIGEEKEHQVDVALLNTRLEEEKERPESCPPFLRFAKRHLSTQGFRRYANRAWLEKRLGASVLSLKQRSRRFSEHIIFYAILGVVIGARLCHILFYENPSHYLLHPLRIIKVWEGGLASHGALFGLLIGMTLFYLRKKKDYPMMSLLGTIDLLVIPGLFAGVLIRLGNFINQEVLGTVTSSFCGIFFGHPVGGVLPSVRHPTQLYEACFYLALFVLFLYRFPKWLFPTGRMAGLCLVMTFTFRFFIEFIKEKQSFYTCDHLLSMGQYLSLPSVVIGIFFLVIGSRYRLDLRVR